MSTVHRTAHVSHAETFLARGARLKLLRFVCLKNNHSRALVMFRTLLEPAPFSSTLSTPTSSSSTFSSSTSSSSVLYPPNTTNPCAPQPVLLFGRFAEQSPLTDSSAEDPTPTPPKDCKSYHQRLMPALAPADWASCVLLCRRSVAAHALLTLTDRTTSASHASVLAKLWAQCNFELRHVGAL